MAKHEFRNLDRPSDLTELMPVNRGQFYLLAIGIDSYTNLGRLYTAAHGAEAIAKVMVEQYCFDKERVVVLINECGTKDAIISALYELARKLKPEDSLLIYYAGHGHLDELGIGSWLPVKGERAFPDTWLFNSSIKDIIKGMKTRHVLLISDSCFSGDFFRETASTPEVITDEYVRMAFRKTSRQALTSGGLEPVRDGGVEGHSVFTWFLLRELLENRSPYLLPLELFDRIKGGVAANARQQPQLGVLMDAGGEIGGEFVLFRQGGTASLEELIERKRREKTALEQREQENKQAAAGQQALLDGKVEELRQLEEKILQLNQRLKGPGTGHDGLSSLLAMVEEKEKQSVEVERLRQEAEQARRQREAELDRLQKESAIRRQREFEADHAKYLKIQSNAHSGEEIKNQAWREICQNWGVSSEAMGKLVYRDGMVTSSWVNSLGMEYVVVPGTKVLFCIWATRVRDYEAFVKATGRQWEKAGFAQGPEHPAGSVSWDDAVAFCLWLTEKENKEGVLARNKCYRLPTDMEWSAAVGLPKEEGRTPRERDAKIKNVYPWGTQWPPPKGAGNYSSSLKVDDYEYTSPVGTFASNRFGLFDMGGNVWEHVENFYDGESGSRVLRGGSWFGDVPDYLLSSYRNVSHPGNRRNGIGFRCVMGERLTP